MNDWMSSADWQGVVDSASADLDQERAKLSRLSELWSLHTVVHSKDHAVSVTVDGRGELVDLSFGGSKYRSMPAAQLASLILETVARARADAMAKVTEVMGTTSVPGLDLEGLMSGKVDPLEAMNSLFEPMLDGLGLREWSAKDEHDGGGTNRG
ncbi:YbaB/EbfC family nucleoid-associated protein [Lentzea sp. NPDC059081]|uniref:YbaB/EbfC family nucleoid-associated protein n=1 Tax=Lentzea sp. NPDC059081 TaxID=3346719 RepID=UPI0036A5350F